MQSLRMVVVEYGKEVKKEGRTEGRKSSEVVKGGGGRGEGRRRMKGEEEEKGRRSIDNEKKNEEREEGKIGYLRHRKRKEEKKKGFGGTSLFQPSFMLFRSSIGS